MTPRFPFSPLARWLICLAFGPVLALAAADPVIPAVLTPGVAAATPAPAAPVKVLTVELVTARRAALAKEIATARADLARLPAAAPEAKADDTSGWLAQEIALLDRIDRVHAEQLATLQHAADLEKEAADVAERTRNRRPPGASFTPPFGLELLDRVYGDRGYLTQSQERLKTDVANATEAWRDAQDTLAEKERARRAARESLQGASPALAQSRLRLAELESRLAQETVWQCEQALHTLRFQQSLLAPKLELLRPELDWLLAHLEFPPAEITAATARRTKRAAELKTALAEATKAADQAGRLAIAAERDGAGPAVELRRATRQLAGDTMLLITAQAERLPEFTTVADQRRRTLSGTATRDEMAAWSEANRDALDTLAKTRRQRVAAVIKTRQELQELPERRDHLTPAEAALREPLVDRERALRAFLQVADAERSDLDTLRTARLRLQEELAARAPKFSFEDTWQATLVAAVAAWNYELFSVQDQPVQVKTVLAVILLVGFGFMVSRWASSAVGGAVFRRLRWHPGRSAAWQTLLFYGLCTIILLTACNLFHLSLTQFSVVSGALAVGLGFGSQALISNFISGLILLVERPVSTGDVIELDGRQVTVERIGARSTIVRSGDNTHIVVPNSQLLDRSVINWTLSDDIVRRKIAVGVVHGTPTREVDRVLREVLRGHEQVLPEPAPRVMFIEFGDNALRFEAIFWSHVGDFVEVENEVRHRIATALAEAGITLANPSHDVNLHSAAPLSIAVTPAAEASPADPAKPPAENRRA